MVRDANGKTKPVLIELRKLKEQHRKLERELEHYGLYAAYSPSAALREQEIKKQKLRNKELITAILRDHSELVDSLEILGTANK